MRRGEFIEIYTTGLGPVSRLQSNGTPKPATTLAALSCTPDVSIGGIPATVQFSGLAPNGVGLYQVNVQVPNNAPVGSAISLSMSLGTAFSNTVTIAVQQ